MQANGPTNPAPGRPRLRRLAGLAGLGLMVLVACYYPLDRWLLERLGWIRAQGWVGVGMYLLVYVVGTVLLVPGTVLTVAAGMAWGVARGSAIVAVSATLGASLAFLVGRYLARDWVRAQVGQRPRLAAIDRAVERDGFKIVCLTRLSPVFPFVLLNYAFGLTGIRFSRYAQASLIGMLPGTVLYVYVGTLLTSLAQLRSGAPEGHSGLYWSGLAVTLVLTWYLTRLAARALRDTVRED